MSYHAIRHFQSIIGPLLLPPTPLPSPPTWFQSLSLYVISVQEAQTMLLLPASEEISRVLLRLNPNKAPGPDGLISGFYKAAWDILGSEVIALSLSSSPHLIYQLQPIPRFSHWYLSALALLSLLITCLSHVWTPSIKLSPGFLWRDWNQSFIPSLSLIKPPL